LREQFTLTCREYEFSFDDALYFLERSTLASQIVQDDGIEDADDTALLGRTSPALSPICCSCSELLCLPRETSLAPEQVRKASQRLTQLLIVQKQPPYLHLTAGYYLGLIDAALDILIEPFQRLGYNLLGVDGPDSEFDEAGADEGPLHS